MLRVAVRRHADVARAASASLEAAAATEVRLILDAADRPVAPNGRLPAVLREPPWEKEKKKKRAPKKLEVARLPLADRVVWHGDEREQWLSLGAGMEKRVTLPKDEVGWDKALTDALRQGANALPYYLLLAPEAMARRAVSQWEPESKHSPMELMSPIVARLELDALRPAGIYAGKFPGPGIASLLPLGSVSLAEIVAPTIGKPTTREAARAWLVRHPEAAAVGLIPLAVGKDAKRRRMAVAALGFLATGGERSIVEEVAQRYGDEVVAALAPVLEADPLDSYPKRLPKMPSFWDPSILPAPELADGSGALSMEALEVLGTMLAFSKEGAVYAGVKQVASACTTDSVVAFSWALFEAWMSDGASSKEKWAFLQLGWLGDDSTAYRLAGLMKSWPAQGAHKRAELGLDVLAEMDSDVALVLVHQMAQKARSKSLKKNARKKIGRIAAMRRLSEAELADRLVPDLDLDASGTTVLDFGARRFRVGFDEALRPFVLDEAGKRLENLPKPGQKDDAEKAPAAQKRFKDLKKNVRTIAKAQVQRFEWAMCTCRRWSASDFQRFVVSHPLLVHLARRLVWGIYRGGSLAGSLRIAEDGTFADAADEAFVISEDATLGIAHALELSADAAARWGDVFGEYELLQPFPQLGRDVYAPEQGESHEELVANRANADIEPERILGLESRGWQRGAVEDGGHYHYVERPAAPGLTARLELSPGISVGWPQGNQPQRIVQVVVRRGGATIPLAELSGVVFSELVRDVASLR